MNGLGRKRVLVVDDESYLVDIWQEVFKLIEVDTVAAHSGEQAISLLRQNPVDMVITDLRMKGSDGFVLLEYLTNEAPEQIPTIVCSGVYTERSEELSSLDVTRVIPKPFDVQKELSYLKDLLYG